MSHKSPRKYQYRQNNAILTVGMDEHGRVFSYIQKNGVIVVKDMYIKIPSEPLLMKQGWKRHHDK